MHYRSNLLLIIIILILIMIIPCGCWDRRELDTLGIVAGVGIDLEKESDRVQVTSQIIKPGEIQGSQTGDGGGGGGGIAYCNVQATGKTVFNALRNSTHEFSRKLYYAHNEVIILGQDAARNGVRRYLDFFTRDPETRRNNMIIVAKGKSSEVLEAKPAIEKIPARELLELIEIGTATSQVSQVTLRDFLTRLMSKTTAPVASLVELKSEGEEKKLYVSGMAVLRVTD